MPFLIQNHLPLQWYRGITVRFNRFSSRWFSDAGHLCNVCCTGSVGCPYFTWSFAQRTSCTGPLSKQVAPFEDATWGHTFSSQSSRWWHNNRDPFHIHFPDKHLSRNPRRIEAGWSARRAPRTFGLPSSAAPIATFVSCPANKSEKRCLKRI